MSEIVEGYRDLEAVGKVLKAERLVEAEGLLGKHFVKLTDHHWRAEIAGRVLDYWPTTGAYRWLGSNRRTRHAEPDFLLEKIEEALR